MDAQLALHGTLACRDPLQQDDAEEGHEPDPEGWKVVRPAGLDAPRLDLGDGGKEMGQHHETEEGRQAPVAHIPGTRRDHHRPARGGEQNEKGQEAN